MGASILSGCSQATCIKEGKGKGKGKGNAVWQECEQLALEKTFEDLEGKIDNNHEDLVRKIEKNHEEILEMLGKQFKNHLS